MLTNGHNIDAKKKITIAPWFTAVVYPGPASSLATIAYRNEIGSNAKYQSPSAALGG